MSSSSKLTEVLTITNPVDVTDSDTGVRTRTYVSAGNMWAKVTAMDAREAYYSEALNQSVQWKVRCRADKRLSSNTILLRGSAKLQVVGIVEEKARSRYVKLTCKEQT